MTTYWRVLFQYILALIAFGYDQTYAQQSNMIVGRVSGPDKKPLSGATVSLKSDPKGPVISYSISRSDGRFAIQINRDHDGQFFLSAEHLGMKGLSTEIRISGGIPEKSYFPFEMEADHRPLDEVKVKAPYPPFSIRGDTVDFKARVYRASTDANCKPTDAQRHPLVIVAHGRIMAGVPTNYLGMTFLTEHLASWGDIVVSVNLDVVNSLQGAETQ